MSQTDTTPQPDVKLQEAPSLKEVLKADNVCDVLTDDDLNRIGAEVKARYNADMVSRSSRESEIMRATDMALQIRSVKSYPFQGASNVNYPLISTAILDFAGRAYGAILPEGDWVKGTVTEKQQDPLDKIQPTADLGAQYMSMQLRDEMPEWEPETDTLLHMLPLAGDVFRKTFYDTTDKRNKSEIIYPSDFIINYYAKTVEESPWTQRFPLYDYQVEERMRAEEYRRINYAMGDDAPSDKRDADVEDSALRKPHWFGEQHTRLDLDQDGYPEPYIVTFHLESGQVVKITRRFRDDDVEYNGKEVIRIKAECYVIHYKFIPSPDGSIYSLGLGVLLLPINETINTLINQIIDAAHIGIAGGGVIAKGAGFKGGSLRFKMNEYKLLDIDPANLQTAIWTKPAPQISPVMFQTLELLIGAAKDISAVKDLLADQSIGNMPEATAMALVESGLTAFKAIYKRIFRSLRNEYKRIAQLNARFIPGKTYFQASGQKEQVEIDPSIFDTPGIIYEPVTGVTSISDTQKAGRADFLGKFLADPLVDPMELRRRLFNYMNIENIDTLLKPQQPQGPDPATQVAMAQAEAQKNDSVARLVRAQTDGVKAQTDVSRARADIKLTGAQAVNQLAQAAKVVTETHLAPLEASLSHIETITGIANDQIQAGVQAPVGGGDAGTQGAPDIQQGAPVPQGPLGSPAAAE